MTQALYNDDAYLKSCEAKIVGADENIVSVDQTVFYPLGGGQLGDTGTLILGGEDYNVIDTIWGQGTVISHILDRALPKNSEGMNVELALNWERRLKLMKMHTSLHIICSMFNFPIVGARVGPEKGHLDYFTDGQPIDKQAENDIFQNLLLQKLNVDTEKVAEAEFLDFMKDRDLIGGMPPVKNGVVRFVRIGDEKQPIDYQPCGGTHVKNTSEISGLAIASIKSKGKGTRRLAVQIVE